ncbi:MAG: SRPBCC family protein [Bacteroidota bacterium]|nr:SRPBCC family protein [Bacteroidota bacterium]
METKEKTYITVHASINAPIEKVWKHWNTPEDIVHWNSASPEWHTPRATIDLRPGGKFTYRMEAKDGSMGFDFWGTFDDVAVNKHIHMTLGDNRTVNIFFKTVGTHTEVIETFEAESENPIEMQQQGWQAILMNFKRFVEKAH